MVTYQRARDRALLGAMLAESGAFDEAEQAWQEALVEAGAAEASAAKEALLEGIRKSLDQLGGQR